MGYEAKMREEIRIFDTKVSEIMTQRKEELNTKTNGELKELCAAKNLKLGVSKEERLDRLLQEAKKDGELDTLAARMLRKARKEAFLATDKDELVKMCHE